MNLSYAKKWYAFWMERLPLASYLLLSLGLALSPVAFGFNHHLLHEPLLVFIATLGIFFSLSLLRLMDDVKDVQKDKEAHPGRPLARGLISPIQAKKMILIMTGIMVAFGLALSLYGYLLAGCFYILIAGYKWLMYREFYGLRFTKSPLLYALSHELILWPTCGFSFALAGPFEWTTLTWFSAMMLGAFFTYELCRKLQPNAPLALGYYRGIYGLKPTLAMAAVACLLVAISSFQCHLQVGSWPLVFSVSAALVHVSYRPHEYKKAELATSISLLLHTWIAPILTLWTSL